MEWVPYVIVAMLAGLVNVIVAWYDLDKRCRYLPFFEPYKSFGFWIWGIVQFSFPSLLFWFMNKLESKPAITFELIFQSLVTGLVFVAVLNASTEVGSLTVNLKPIYDFFVDIVAYKLIAREQTRETAIFMQELEEKLSQNTCNIVTGLKFLENYFREDISLNEKVKEDYQNKINQINTTITEQEEKIKAIKTLLKEVRRKDLPEALKKFNIYTKLK